MGGKGKAKARVRVGAEASQKGPAAGIQAHWEFAAPDTQLFDLFLFYYWGVAWRELQSDYNGLS